MYSIPTRRHALDHLARQLQADLGRNVVGLYVYGSLTQNAFDARRSDVDCVAVIRRGLSPVVVSRLRANLGRLSGRHSWMRRLQLTILIQRELLRFNGDGWPGPVRGVGGRPTGAMPPSRRAAFYTHWRRGGWPPSARRRCGRSGDCRPFIGRSSAARSRGHRRPGSSRSVPCAVCWSTFNAASRRRGRDLACLRPPQAAPYARSARRQRASRPGDLVLPPPPDLRATLLAAWRTNNRVTVSLVEHLPSALWDIVVPGAPRRTIRAIAAHLHNARCMWVKTLGREHGIPAPLRVDHRRVTRRQLVAALKRSSHGIEALLKLGAAAGGQVPPSRGYVWRNLSLDVGHVLTYFVAHEAHHRGQIVMVARQTGQRLPRATTDGLWQWKTDAAHE